MFMTSKSNSLHDNNTKYGQTNFLLSVSLANVWLEDLQKSFALSRCFLTKATSHILRKWQLPEQVAKNASEVIIWRFSTKKNSKNTMQTVPEQVLYQVIKESTIILITVQM